LEWTREVITKLGLTLNETKTCIRQARKESFNFLGYTFGPHRFRKDGHWYLGASPAKKAVARIKEKVGDLLVPSNVGTWTEVRDRLNRVLRGWSAYYSYGTRMPAYRAIDNHVYQSVRNFLRRRHKVQSRGTTRFSTKGLVAQPAVCRGPGTSVIESGSDTRSSAF
jgi:RNA-directed DNA polymerase